jgi:hypothetical protein
MPKDGNPIWLNRAFHVSTTIMRFVVASAAKAELSALYHNCRMGIIFQLTLAKMGHPQPRTPVHCNNAKEVAIANNTIKWQWSITMEIRIFWVDKNCTGNVCTTVAPRARKSCQLPKQAPCWFAPCGSKTLVLTCGKFTLGTTLGSEA